jgi:hypothetical protein
MTHQSNTKSMFAKLGILAAAFYLYTGNAAADGDAEITANVSGRASLEAAQSMEAGTRSGAEVDGTAGAKADAGLRAGGSKPDDPGVTTGASGSASGNSRLAVDADTVTVPEVDIADAVDLAATSVGRVRKIADTSAVEGTEVDPDVATVPKMELSGNGGAVAEAGAAAGTMAEVASSEVVDAVVDSTVKSAVEGEIASAVEASVQDDIRNAIEADLITDLTGSLPLPGTD